MEMKLAMEYNRIIKHTVALLSGYLHELRLHGFFNFLFILHSIDVQG